MTTLADVWHAFRILGSRLGSLRWDLSALLTLVHPTTGEVLTMADTTTHPTEELLAAPLPELIRDLGLAVAGANKAMSEIKDPPMMFTVDKAEIEISVAISIEKSSKGEIKAGGNISAFSVNASYAKTYGFKEEASSRIKITLAAVPRKSEG